MAIKKSKNQFQKCPKNHTLALKNLPLGTAYAIWTGIGTIGTCIFGVILFKEPVSALKFVCIGLIITGITGLKLITN